jgi:hypothetical protein
VHVVPPGRRATAADCLKHPWLLYGEMDIDVPRGVGNDAAAEYDEDEDEDVDDEVRHALSAEFYDAAPLLCWL